MVTGKDPVPGAAHGGPPRLVGGVVVGFGVGLPARQVIRRAVEQFVQLRPAQRLQEIQLLRQRLFQHGSGVPARRYLQAEVLILQQQVQQGAGPVGAAAEQGGLKGRQRAAQFRFPGGQRRPQGLYQRRVQQAAEHDQRVQAR